MQINLICCCCFAQVVEIILGCCLLPLKLVNVSVCNKNTNDLVSTKLLRFVSLTFCFIIVSNKTKIVWKMIKKNKNLSFTSNYQISGRVKCKLYLKSKSRQLMGPRAIFLEGFFVLLFFSFQICLTSVSELSWRQVSLRKNIYANLRIFCKKSFI